MEGNLCLWRLPRVRSSLCMWKFYEKSRDSVAGNVLYWEWILADGNLPKDHAVRYSERIW